MQASAPLIDVIDSSDALLRFMEREEISSRDNPNELLPHHELLKHRNAIAREIVEGERVLSFDLVAIPLSANPGRKAAVRLFIRVENRVRELRKETTKAPFYPYDSYYLLTYLDHISIWQPRFEKDARTWLTDWEKHKAQLAYEWLAYKLMDTPCFRSSSYGNLSMAEAVDLVRTDLESRIALNTVLLRSYIDFIINVPDSYSTAYPEYKDTNKMDVIETVKTLTKRGINPFDILYGMGDVSFKRKRNVASASILAMMLLTLFLIMYACVNDLDI